jgi:L-alanine-DL-glutamate epimerase-like enolase superfamily enzyme
MTRTIVADVETWPISDRFVISRGAKTEAHVVVVRITRDGHTGLGEAVPYARYGETIDATLAAIHALPADVDRAWLQDLLAPGAARNAVDCALWDLEAKRTGVAAHRAAGVGALGPLVTCYTLSLDTPEGMAAKARSVPHLPLLKLKLGGAGDEARMAAVRAARPDARLVADANEAWPVDEVPRLLDAAQRAGLELIEQPLPQGADAALAAIAHRVAICADESAHTAADVAALADRYDAVNIKLDKAGGLTGALDMAEAARSAGLDIMVGCMVATSLAMAPALIVAQGARWVDLDGPLLLARDRPNGLVIRDGVIAPPGPGLWG